MLANADTPLTLAGFVALGSLGIGAIGLALNTASKNNDLRERIVKLETQVADHLRNGIRHDR